MIQRLRRKLVIVLMCVELTFTLSILTGFYVNARAGFIRLGDAAMHQAARRAAFSHDGFNAPPRFFRDMPDRDEGMPLAVVAVDEAGNASLLENRLSHLSDQELLDAYAALPLPASSDTEQSGSLSGAGLRYRRFPSEGGKTCVVFISVLLERQILRNQLALSLVILLVSSAVFYGISLLLSRFLVRPVADAFDRERQFIADASHDLKTPLTVILSNAEMLLASGALHDEKSLRRLDNICAESRRMHSLVQSLLTLARSDAGRQIPVHTPQPLSYIVACALSGFEPVLFDSGRTLEEDIAPSLHVSGDESQLRELLDILLDNAGKYSDPASTIRVSLHPVRKEAVLLVSSMGNPIPESQREAVFRRFYRLDQSRGQQAGYGLGLAIAHSIVLQHGGHIGVRGGAANENVFFVRLPLVSPPES